MAEESKGAKQTAKAALKAALGIILLSVGVWLIWLWQGSLLIVIKGCLGIAVVLGGIIFLAIAKE